MKKIFVFFVSIFYLFSFGINFAEASSSNLIDSTWCSFDLDLKDALKSCLSNSDLVWVNSEDLKLWWKGFSENVNRWTKAIWFYIWLFAVFGIVFSGFYLVVSAWNDDKITKAKWVFKWAVFWFLAAAFAWLIISIVVRLLYSIS